MNIAQPLTMGEFTRYDHDIAVYPGVCIFPKRGSAALNLVLFLAC